MRQEMNMKKEPNKSRPVLLAEAKMGKSSAGKSFEDEEVGTYVDWSTSKPVVLFPSRGSRALLGSSTCHSPFLALPLTPPSKSTSPLLC